MTTNLDFINFVETKTTIDRTCVDVAIHIRQQVWPKETISNSSVKFANVTINPELITVLFAGGDEDYKRSISFKPDCIWDHNVLALEIKHLQDLCKRLNR